MAVECARGVQRQGKPGQVCRSFHVPAAALQGWLPSRRSEMYAVCTNAKGFRSDSSPPLFVHWLKLTGTRLRCQGTTGVAAGGLRTQTGCWPCGMGAGAGVAGQSPGSLAAGSRWREVASPGAHCAKRLVPVPAGSAAGPVPAAGVPAGSWGSWGAAPPAPSAGQVLGRHCWCCARLHS